MANNDARRDKGDGSIYQRKSDGRWVGKFTDEYEITPRYVYGKTEAEARKSCVS